MSLILNTQLFHSVLFQSVGLLCVSLKMNGSDKGLKTSKGSFYSLNSSWKFQLITGGAAVPKHCLAPDAATADRYCSQGTKLNFGE